jgi:hypothetical protein
MNRSPSRFALVLVSVGLLPVGLSACEGAAPAVDASASDAPACAPDLAVFETEVRPHIERHCGSCHGTTPDFGAPVTLLDGPSLLARRDDGTRLVDRIAMRLIDGSMPPVGMPRLLDADADAIVSWASCGAQTAPPGTGLRSSGQPFLSPDDAPAGLATLDFTADEYVVLPDTRDDYRCFVFDADVSEPVFARRFEMIFDETRVLHHLVLLRDTERRTEPGDFACIDGSGMPAGSQYLYAWAPGQSALEFPEGGLRISPGERFILQIHYNNGAHVPDVRDSSGVRLYLGPVAGPEYGMVAIGPTNFEIPAHGRETVSSRCTFATETRLLAGLPHMHLLGDSFVEDVVRAGGGTEPMIRIEGWDFGTQLFYSFPITLAAGDAITTSCTFENTRDVPTVSGAGTDDEMCFDFVYATPPPASRYCDEGAADRPSDVRYVPGECLPAGSPTDDLPLVRGSWEQAESPPALAQAGLPDGRWLLEAVEFYLTNPNTPVGTIDLEATYVLARGQVVTTAGHLSYDLSNDVVVLTESGLRFGGPDSYTMGGVLPVSSPATMPLDCPEGATEGVDLEWGIEGDLLTIGFESSNVPGSRLWPRYQFRRLP